MSKPEKARGVSTPATANDVLRSFVPKTDFVGEPFGDGHQIHFRAGVPSVPVPSDFAAKHGEVVNPPATKTAADHG